MHAETPKYWIIELPFGIHFFIQLWSDDKIVWKYDLEVVCNCRLELSIECTALLANQKEISKGELNTIVRLTVIKLLHTTSPYYYNYLKDINPVIDMNQLQCKQV